MINLAFDVLNWILFIGEFIDIPTIPRPLQAIASILP